MPASCIDRTESWISTEAAARRTNWWWCSLLSTVLSLIATLGMCGFAPPTQDKPVWFWFATCGGPALTVEVQLDGIVLDKTTVPLCSAPRGSAAEQGQKEGRIEFTFAATRTIVWEGYRDTPDKTPAGQHIEGNIWLAGADPDALILGVSFVTGKTILMNTTHIARPKERVVTGIGRGLVLVTYPAKQ